MSYHHHHHTHIGRTVRIRRIVWACAWCNPETYAPLKEGQKYTHGICSMHKRQLMRKTARLFSKREPN